MTTLKPNRSFRHFYRDNNTQEVWQYLADACLINNHALCSLFVNINSQQMGLIPVAQFNQFFVEISRNTALAYVQQQKRLPTR